MSFRYFAADVSAEFTKTLEWQLTAPEFIEFMKVLMSPAPETAAMTAARAKAEALLGPAPAA